MLTRVTVTAEGFANPEQLRALGRDLRLATVRALNRTIQSVQTATVRALAQDTGLKQSVIRSRLDLRRATVSREEASLTVSGRRIPLIDFQARGPEPSRGRGRGVSYRLPGGRSLAPHAFLATMRSGHRGVFARSGSSIRRSHGAWSLNLPIHELFGPSLPHVTRRLHLFDLQPAEAKFRRELEHQITFLLSQRGFAEAGSEEVA